MNIRACASLLLLLLVASPAAAQTATEIDVSKIFLGGATLTNPSGANVSVGAGTMVATTFSGSCASCTSIPAGQLTGTITSSVQDNITRLGTVASVAGWSTNLVPTFGETYDVGTAFKPWRKAFIGAMSATLFIKETQTLYGGWLAVTKNAGTLPSSVSAVATTVDFGMTMTLNQFVLIRAADNNSGAITHEYMKVGALVSGTTYNVTRNLSGIGAKDWAAGTPFAVRGVAGDGWVELNAFDTPRMSVWTQGSAYNNSAENIRIGHLTGMPNSSSGIGAYMGDATNYFRWDGSALTVKGVGFSLTTAGITVGSGASAYDSTGALKFNRETSWSAGAGDVNAVWSENSGGAYQNLWLENTTNRGTGTTAKAKTCMKAQGWDTTAFATQALACARSEPSGLSKFEVTATDTTLSGTMAVTGTSTLTGAATLSNTMNAPNGLQVDVTRSVGDNGTYTLPGGTSPRGLLVIMAREDTASCIYQIRGGSGAVIEAVDPGGLCTAVSGTASQVNIYYDGGAGSYKIENKRGATRTFELVMIGTGIL